MPSPTVIITGSSSGIGLGIARAFAGGGYNVVLNGLEANGAEIARSLANELGVACMFSPANMLEPFQLRELVSQAVSRFGRIDVLVNNAGIQHVAPIAAFPEEKWDAIMGINLSSAFHLTKAVWPHMQQQHFGRIINIASAHGLVASPNKSAYVAAKHGLIGLTKTAALEGAPFGITCNAVCPGYVRTPLVDQQITDQANMHQLSEAAAVHQLFLQKHAIKEFISVDAIAGLCLFLASQKASTLTGAALPVDAGWTAQ